MKVYQRIWGEVDEETGAKIDTYVKEVPTTACKETDFSWNDSQEHRFFPLLAKFQSEVKRNMSKLMCLNENNVII